MGSRNRFWVSEEDPLNTVLLAIMAAALRVAQSAPSRFLAEYPHCRAGCCANSPNKPVFRSKRSKTHWLSPACVDIGGIG